MVLTTAILPALLGLAQVSTSSVATATRAEELAAPLLAEEEEGAEVEDEEEPGDDADRAQFIEAIEIIGNEKTERAVVLRRLLLTVGDLLEDDKVEESRLRLLNTGYFKSVEFSLRRGSSRGKVLLFIEVEERNTILIDEIFLGFSRVVPFYGGFGVVETNLLGRGVSAGVNFVLGEDRRALELRLFVPDLSNTPLQLSASAIFLRGSEILAPDRLEVPALGYQRIGGTLALGLGVGPAQRVSLQYRLESVSAARLPNLDPIILRRAPQVQFGDSGLSTLSLLYERDTRDDPFVPTQGARVALGVEVGTKLIGSSYEFSKYTASAEQAFRPFRDHSLILQVFGGLVQGQAPFFNQFFLNDYAYFVVGRDALPRNAELNFSESNDYDDLLVSAGAEYVVPIQEGSELLYKSYLFAGVDVSATASLDELQEDDTGRGTGGKLPLSFDVGLKFDTWIGNFTVSLAYMLDLVF